MSLDYPNREVWLAKRDTPRGMVGRMRRNVRISRMPPSVGKVRRTKAERRQDKAARMAKMYREFFADPVNQARIEELKFTWCIHLHPRLVRDTVLGSRHD